MSAMGSYVVFCFFCGQFQALFNWTHMGTLLSIKGAELLREIGFTGLPSAWLYSHHGAHQPFYVKWFCQMGHLRADLCPDVHDARVSSRLCPAPLSPG